MRASHAWVRGPAPMRTGTPWAWALRTRAVTAWTVGTPASGPATTTEPAWPPGAQVTNNPAPGAWPTVWPAARPTWAVTGRCRTSSNATRTATRTTPPPAMLRQAGASTRPPAGRWATCSPTIRPAWGSPPTATRRRPVAAPTCPTPPMRPCVDPPTGTPIPATTGARHRRMACRRWVWATARTLRPTCRHPPAWAPWPTTRMTRGWPASMAPTS